MNFEVTRIRTGRIRILSRSDRQKLRRKWRRYARCVNGAPWPGGAWMLTGTTIVSKYAGYYNVRMTYGRYPDTDFTPLFGT